MKSQTAWATWSGCPTRGWCPSVAAGALLDAVYAVLCGFALPVDLEESFQRLVDVFVTGLRSAYLAS